MGPVEITWRGIWSAVTFEVWPAPPRNQDCARASTVGINRAANAAATVMRVIRTSMP
jgi:hypothetical protein